MESKPEMRYLIDETLVETSEIKFDAEHQFVAVVTPQEWERDGDSFDMGIDIDLDLSSLLDMQAEENYDAITGVIRKPDYSDFTVDGTKFRFALDEKGVVFVDSTGLAAQLTEEIRTTHRWRKPGLERFVYEFLTALSADVTPFMTSVERELDAMERAIYADDAADDQAERVNAIRSDLRDLDDYLEHLQDFVEVLEENENGFFKDENLRYFRLFFNRMEKLRDKAQSLREQAMQLRDLYKMHLDIRQNRIMTVLTVVTAIFAPLTLIAGWYGMNFVHMPELEWAWAYPAVFVLCIALTVGMIVAFKRMKWL